MTRSTLSWNRYGKSRIRLVKVRRQSDPHEVVDLTLDIQLEGAFDAVYVDGDNRSCLPTDTMKNTVYAFARRDPIEHVEGFAIRLAAHFAAKHAVTSARISAVEQGWRPLSHRHAFVQAGPEQWTAVVVRDSTGTDIRSGLAGLVVLKTTDSAFSGFPRDEFTTLPETEDRILATSITATWRYLSDAADFGARHTIRTALVDAFARHASKSVQHTLYAMAEAALAACAEVAEITLTMPNRHHLLVDLKPFGLDNPNEVFVPTEEPHGLIEATVQRSVR